jgi:hypothetical protein
MIFRTATYQSPRLPPDCAGLEGLTCAAVAPSNQVPESRGSYKPLFDAQDTRLAAHAHVLATKRETYSRILEHAEQCGRLGFTADELTADWGCSPNHTAPRVTELVASGALVKTEERRPTRSGCLARVYVAKRFALQPPRRNSQPQPSLFDLAVEQRDNG